MFQGTIGLDGVFGGTEYTDTGDWDIFLGKFDLAKAP
jgi:hypothetical protein